MNVIDIRSELSRFTWRRARWSPDKLIACSPFRYDSTPSFYVYLTDTPSARAGSWGDTGADSDEWRKGGFVQLLSFLREETTEETIEYLRATYDYGADESGEHPDHPVLNPLQLAVKHVRPPLDLRILDDYRLRHPYLGVRGISEAVQRLMAIGYDQKRKAVTMPWFDGNGRLMNIKYRRVDEKTFWYQTGGRPIRELVYGINIIYERRLTRALLVEGEVDAMTLMSAGHPAIAVGGARLSEYQADIIRGSPLEEVIIMRDNDAAGRRLQRRVIDALLPYISVKIASVPGRYKDVNEFSTVESLVNVSKSVQRARTVKPLISLSLAL